MHIHHLALRTADVASLTAFYRDVVGLAVRDCPSAGCAWLRAGECIVMIEPRAAGEVAAAPGSMDLVAFAIRPDERDAFEARLAAAGVAVEGHTSFSTYFRDPDGRRVGVSHYR